MRDQADLREQAKRHAGGECHESAILAEVCDARGLDPLGGLCGLGRVVAIGAQTHRAGCGAQQSRGQDRDRGNHRDSDPDRRGGETERGDGGDPDRREQRAAHAGPVIGGRQRRRPAPLEPWGDDGVDTRRAHRDPADPRGDRGGENMPRFRRMRPSDHADGERHGPRQRHARHAEAFVQARQLRDRQSAERKVESDGGGNESDRPAMFVDRRLQIDRRRVKADAPAEHRDDESAGDDAPAIEDRFHGRHHRRVRACDVTVAAEVSRAGAC